MSRNSNNGSAAEAIADDEEAEEQSLMRDVEGQKEGRLRGDEQTSGDEVDALVCATEQRAHLQHPL
jgi:hypothetical protein